MLITDIWLIEQEESLKPITNYSEYYNAHLTQKGNFNQRHKLSNQLLEEIITKLKYNNPVQYLHDLYYKNLYSCDMILNELNEKWIIVYENQESIRVLFTKRFNWILRDENRTTENTQAIFKTQFHERVTKNIDLMSNKFCNILEKNWLVIRDYHFNFKVFNDQKTIFEKILYILSTLYNQDNENSINLIKSLSNAWITNAQIALNIQKNIDDLFQNTDIIFNITTDNIRHLLNKK